MKKRIEVATTDKRQFVKDVLALGAMGAALPDDAGVFGGIMLRTTLEVDEDTLVEPSGSVRVLPITNEEREAYIRQQAQNSIIPDSNASDEKETVVKRGRKKE